MNTPNPFLIEEPSKEESITQVEVIPTQEVNTPNNPIITEVPVFKIDLDEDVNTIPEVKAPDSNMVTNTSIKDTLLNDQPTEKLEDTLNKDLPLEEPKEEFKVKKLSDNYLKPFESPININLNPIHIYTTKTTPEELDELLTNYSEELISEAETNKQYEKVKNKDGTENEKLYLTPTQENKLKTLSDNLVEAMYSIYHYQELDGMFDRDNTEFTQTLKTTSGNQIRIAHPSFSFQDLSKIKDNDFSKAFHKITGSGDESLIPLWSSGILLLIKPITERSLIRLHEKLIKDKEDLGRKTIGFSLSSDDVFLHKDIIDTILDHVIDCNLIKWSKESLLKLITTADLDSLYAGFLETIYPSGYPINHVCKNVLKGKCTHTITSKMDESGKLKPDTMLNFKKLVIVDKSRLNQSMIDHMESITKKHKEEVILKYQEAIINLYPEKYRKDMIIFKSTSNETSVSIKFKVPSLHNFIEDNKNTITLLESMINGNITNDLKQSEKDELLEKYSSQLSLFKTLPWIETVNLNSLNYDGSINASKSSNKKEDILTVLESFNSNKEVNENITKMIHSFKENVFISMTGIPNFICPDCKESQNEEGSKLYSVIPFKILGFFLIQIALRFRDY